MTAALDAFLAARAYETGRALRRTTLRHAYLADPPLGVVIWRLGGERFRAAAVAWGPLGEPFQLAVPGEPRNRDLYFRALSPFAADLCDLVHRAAALKVARQLGRHQDLIPAGALQIVVPNRATVSALGLLGRYLAYLSDRGGVTPHPALIEAGKHLRFYARHTRVAGQSLLVPLDRLLSEHWAMLLSPFEQANLAALDAQIEPPDGLHAFDASAAAEAQARIGPDPTEDIDRVTGTLLADFNAARRGRTDQATVEPLLDRLRDHYQRLIEPVWQLMTRVVAREQQLPAAPSVQRRFEADREAFGRHADWVMAGGRYRTTDTPRQTAMTLRRLEDALARYDADKAVEDPACMIPYLLNGSAVRGVVASINEIRVQGSVNMVRRAVIALDTDEPTALPRGKELWWTATASGYPWEVQAARPQGAGSRVTLMLRDVPPRPDRLPAAGERITLSTLHTGSNGYYLTLPQTPPWTHRPAVSPPSPEPIDAGDNQPPPTAVDGATVTDPGRYT